MSIAEKQVRADSKKSSITIGVIAIILLITYITGFSFKGLENPNFGIWSVVPALVAVTLAFITREAMFSLLIAAIAGIFIQGRGLWGLSGLFTKSLGNGDFIWVVLIEVFIGVLVAFFFKSGSTKEFARVVSKRVSGRKNVQLMAWFLGMFIFFSDYFSPLFVGPVIRFFGRRIFVPFHIIFVLQFLFFLLFSYSFRCSVLLLLPFLCMFCVLCYVMYDLFLFC